jgi:hypothetical protein
MTERIEDWLSGGPELERVIEIKERARTRDGVPITIVSLEIWENSIRLVYVVTTLETQGASGADEFEAWQLSDGRGTRFSFAGGSGGGDGLRMYSNVSWTPRPAGDATEMNIENPVLGIHLSVPLTAP